MANSTVEASEICMGPIVHEKFVEDLKSADVVIPPSNKSKDIRNKEIKSKEEMDLKSKQPLLNPFFQPEVESKEEGKLKGRRKGS